MKKQRPTPEEEAEAALETGTLKTMMKDHGNILATMNAYVCELMDRKVEEKNLRELMKLLLKEGWLDEKGMERTEENELTLTLEGSQGLQRPPESQLGQKFKT